MHKVDEVIERLRAWADNDIEYGHTERGNNMLQAVDLLASMKEALEPFAQEAVFWPDGSPDNKHIESRHCINVGHLLRARNALNGEKA